MGHRVRIVETNKCARLKSLPKSLMMPSFSQVAMVSRNAENKLASGMYTVNCIHSHFLVQYQKRNNLSSAYLHLSNSVVRTEKQGLFELTQ